MPTKRQRTEQHNARSVSWSVNDFNYYLDTDNMVPGTTMPYSAMLASVSGSDQHSQQQQTIVPSVRTSSLVIPSTAAPAMVEGSAIAQQRQQQTDFFSQQVPVARAVTTSSDFDALLMSSTADNMTPLFAAAASSTVQPNSISEQPSSTSFAMPFDEAIASAVTSDYVMAPTTTGPVMTPQFCYQ
ncbi:hypothetical protein D0Z03_001620 [Geotrichum reessii]|nr:hypothetical protein D0Z03_001620 [Galactomyces reessii]